MSILIYNSCGCLCIYSDWGLLELTLCCILVFLVKERIFLVISRVLPLQFDQTHMVRFLFILQVSCFSPLCASVLFSGHFAQITLPCH